MNRFPDINRDDVPPDHRTDWPLVGSILGMMLAAAAIGFLAGYHWLLRTITTTGG